VFCPCHKLSYQWSVNAFATFNGVWGSLKIWKSLAWLMFLKKINLYALFFSHFYVLVVILHIMFIFVHSSYCVYALFTSYLCMFGSSSVYATTFNNFDFLAFDNLNLSLAIINDLDLLVLNNLQLLLCMITFQMLRLCICIITHFAIVTNFTKVEVMQLATIQVQAQFWESHSWSLIC
jgi:hypothetical protein